MSWKSALVGSALALWAQTGIAKAPCPDRSPLHDTVGVVQADTRARMENRLRAIETEKRHQVVVMTVKSVEEYWYDSIEQMANAIWKDCRVGFKWENTGVVVLYTKQPSRVRMETAATEKYLEDLRGNHIINSAKQACQKDISCWLDFITNEIDKVIRKEFPDKQSVQVIDDAKMKAEAEEDRRRLNELLGSLAIWVVVIIVIWGVVFGTVKWVWAINKRNRKKTLKKEIFELSVRANSEAQKYPEWFQNEYCRRVINAANKMQAYTDEEVDDIIDSSQETRNYLEYKDFIEKEIRWWEKSYIWILVESWEIQERYNATLLELNSVKEALVREGYQFEEVEIPKLPISASHMEVASKWGNVIATLNRSIERLQAIRWVYVSMAGTDEQVLSSFSEQRKWYLTLSDKHKEIYGTTPGFELTGTERQVNDFISRFRMAYDWKHMITLTALLQKKDGLFRSLADATREAASAIRTYEEIPSQIASREKLLAGIKSNQSYVDTAKKYSRETGRDVWLSFDLPANIQTLSLLLSTIKANHRKKERLAEISRQLRGFDAGFTKIEEYIWLWVALASHLAQQKLAEAQRRERLREMASKRPTSHEYGNSRVDSVSLPPPSPYSRTTIYSRTSSPSTAPEPAPTTPPWSSGGGDGFSWGGTTNEW